jgi:hypothetical protein
MSAKASNAISQASESVGDPERFDATPLGVLGPIDATTSVIGASSVGVAVAVRGIRAAKATLLTTRPRMRDDRLRLPHRRVSFSGLARSHVALGPSALRPGNQACSNTRFQL